MARAKKPATSIAPEGEGFVASCADHGWSEFRTTVERAERSIADHLKVEHGADPEEAEAAAEDAAPEIDEPDTPAEA